MVTGVGRGLGRAIALRLAWEGAAVVAADLEHDGATLTVELIGGEVPAIAVCADCATGEGIEAVLDAADHLGGPADALVNNAGVLSDVRVPDVERAEIERVLRVNTIAPMLMTTAFARRLIAVGGVGAVVCITSTTADVASLPGLSTYAASKGAVLAYARGAATDLARYGIRVNSVAPGWIRTDMTKSLVDDADAPLLGRIPMRRAADPSEIAAAVAWLLSDDAGYVTGTSLAVDGGWLGY